MGRHRHAVTVRADGLGVVLGPLLNDPRVVFAALVDVDSGMVLDACTPDRPGARYWGTDLEAAGAGHAELARVALALPGRAGPVPAGDELVVSAGPGRHHLVLALPDPHGGRLALSVVVEGSGRLARRVLRKLRAVPAETLTAGPTVVRRPGVGGWVMPVGGLGSGDGPRPDDPAEPAPVDGRSAPGPGPVADRFAPGYRGRFAGPPAGPGPAPVRAAPGGVDPHDDVFADLERRTDRRLGPVPERPGARDGWPVGPPAAAGPGPGWSAAPVPAEPFALRTEITGPRPVPGGLFDPAPPHPDAGGFGPVPHPEPHPEPARPGPASGGAPIGLADPPLAPGGPLPVPPAAPGTVPPGVTAPEAPPRAPRPPAPPSALPPGRRG